MTTKLLAQFLLLLLLTAAPTSLCSIRKASNYLSIDIPSRICKVTSYGAKGNGVADDTVAVQTAINACAQKGGGSVSFPKNMRFLILPIWIKGNVSRLELKIEKNATILLAKNRTAWPDGNFAAGLINFIQGGKNLTDLVISGPGTIDGQGALFWSELTLFRPYIVKVDGARRLLINGVNFLNAPNHFLRITGIKVEVANSYFFAPDNSPNTDGMSLEGRDFYVHDSNITVGDDNVAVRANNTFIEKCFFGSGHGISIGSLGNAHIRNLTVRDIVIRPVKSYVQQNGLRIKTIEKTWGSVVNVSYENVYMEKVVNPILIDMFYGSPGTSAKTTMSIHGITYRNITAINCPTAGSFICDVNSPCYDITLDKVNIGSPNGFKCKNAYGSSTNVSPPSCLVPGPPGA